MTEMKPVRLFQGTTGPLCRFYVASVTSNRLFSHHQACILMNAGLPSAASDLQLFRIKL